MVGNDGDDDIESVDIKMCINYQSQQASVLNLTIVSRKRLHSRHARTRGMLLSLMYACAITQFLVDFLV